MLALGAHFALFALLQLAPVHADPIPLEPSATSVFNEGGQCTTQWTADSTGVWKVMNIELMTGSNQQMVHLRTVGTVDGTSTTNTTYSYPCLGVTPNSQIYFYQFTSPASPDVLWTTRFTLADATGNSVPPDQQETDASGKLVLWGTGKLKDPSLSDLPPVRGTSGAPASIPATAASSAVNGTTPTVPAAVTTPTITPPPTGNSNDSNNNINNNNNGSDSTSASTTRPVQAKPGSAVSYHPTVGLGILATAILCGSMLL